MQMRCFISILLTFIFFSAKGQDNFNDTLNLLNYSDLPTIVDKQFDINKDLSSFEEQSFQFNKNGERLNLILLIGNLFEAKDKYVIKGYSLSDSSLQLNIYVKQKSNWRELFSQQIYPIELGGVINRIVSLKNLNNDSLIDLVVTKKYYEIHPRELSDAWIFKNKRFIKIANFDLMCNPEYDKQSDLFYTYYSTGCADMSMKFQVYKLQNDTITNIQTVNCDCCYSNDCNITIDSNKTIKVKLNEAYKFVPKYFSDRLKKKLEN
jgi:hypothetical protein